MIRSRLTGTLTLFLINGDVLSCKHVWVQLWIDMVLMMVPRKFFGAANSAVVRLGGCCLSDVTW